MARSGSIRYYLDGDATGLRRALGGAESDIGRFGQRATRAGGVLTAGLTLPIVGLGAASVKMASDFDASMSKITGLVGVSRQEVQAMKADVLELSGETAKAPQELADALFFITSAGLRGQEALDALEASAKASAAGLGETAAIADAVTSAMNAYGSENLSAAQATEVLVATVREGKLEAGSLAGEIGKVIPIASNMGVEFHEVGAALAAMSTTGTNAAEGATQLQAFLTGLAKETPAVKSALEDLDLSYDGVRKTLDEDGLLAALDLFREASDGNIATLSKLFPNVRALRGVLDLTGKQAEANAETFKDLEDNTGDLAAAFGEAADTDAFKMQQALTELKVAGVEMGSELLPVVTDVAEVVADGARAFNDLDPAMKRVVGGAAAAAAALGPLLLVVGGISRGIDGISRGAGAVSRLGRGAGAIATPGATPARPMFVAVVNGVPGGGTVPLAAGGAPAAGRAAAGAAIPGVSGFAAGAGAGAAFGTLAVGTLAIGGLAAGGVALDRSGLGDRAFEALSFGTYRAGGGEAAKRRAAQDLDAYLGEWREGMQGDVGMRMAEAAYGDHAQFKAHGARQLAESAKDAVVGWERAFLDASKKKPAGLDQMVNQAISRLSQLNPQARALGADAILEHARGMESRGEAPRGAAAAVAQGIRSQMGELPVSTRADGARAMVEFQRGLVEKGRAPVESIAVAVDRAEAAYGKLPKKVYVQAAKTQLEAAAALKEGGKLSQREVDQQLDQMERRWGRFPPAVLTQARKVTSNTSIIGSGAEDVARRVERALNQMALDYSALAKAWGLTRSEAEYAARGIGPASAYAGSRHAGGRIPGSNRQERLVRVLGGERWVTRHQAADADRITGIPGFIDRLIAGNRRRHDFHTGGTVGAGDGVSGDLTRPTISGLYPFAVLGQAMVDQAHGGLSTKLGSLPSALGATAGAVASGPVLTMARQMAAARGWTGAQWSALRELGRRESGWNPDAVNPSSGALGIPQLLPSAGHRIPPGFRTDPQVQIAWMLDYIAGRYGSPVAALSWHDAHNWYHSGGVVEPLMDLHRIASQQAGGGFRISSGVRPGAVTVDGNVSLHASGRAIDVDGGNLDAYAAAVRSILGLSGSGWTENSIAEVGWRTMVGGNHYTHVHVGANDASGISRALAGMVDQDTAARAGAISPRSRSSSAPTAADNRRFKAGIIASARGSLAAPSLAIGGPGIDTLDEVNTAFAGSERRQGLREKKREAAVRTRAREELGIENPEKLDAIAQAELLKMERARIKKRADVVRRAAGRARSNITRLRRHKTKLFKALRKTKASKRARLEQLRDGIAGTREKERDAIQELKGLMTEAADLHAQAAELNFDIGQLEQEIAQLPDVEPDVDVGDSGDLADGGEAQESGPGQLDADLAAAQLTESTDDDIAVLTEMAVEADHDLNRARAAMDANNTAETRAAFIRAVEKRNGLWQQIASLEEQNNTEDADTLAQLEREREQRRVAERRGDLSEAFIRTLGGSGDIEAGSGGTVVNLFQSVNALYPADSATLEAIRHITASAFLGEPATASPVSASGA